MRERIVITELDYQKLSACLFRLRESRAEDYRYLRDLEKELERALVVAPDEVPRTVVTMHSEFEMVDLQTRSKDRYKLVYPEEADIEAGKLSVLSPMGTAVLGYRRGDTFEWEGPRGKRRGRIEKVLFQPEASGQFQV